MGSHPQFLLYSWAEGSNVVEVRLEKYLLECRKIMGRGLVSLNAGQWPGVSFSYTRGVDHGGRTRKEKNVCGKRRRQRVGRR